MRQVVQAWKIQCRECGAHFEAAHAQRQLCDNCRLFKNPGMPGGVAMQAGRMGLRAGRHVVVWASDSTYREMVLGVQELTWMAICALWPPDTEVVHVQSGDRYIVRAAEKGKVSMEVQWVENFSRPHSEHRRQVYRLAAWGLRGELPDDLADFSVGAKIGA